MTWFEIAALAAVLVGLGGGAFLVAQRPTFWIGLATEIFRRLLPILLKSSPETQAREQKRIREGRERNDR